MCIIHNVYYVCINIYIINFKSLKDLICLTIYKLYVIFTEGLIRTLNLHSELYTETLQRILLSVLQSNLSTVTQVCIYVWTVRLLHTPNIQ